MSRPGGHAITPRRVRRTLGGVDQVRYAERLTLPWYWWPGALAVAGVLAGQAGLTVAAVPAWVPATALLPVVLGSLWWLGRLPVRVTGGEFRVDDARLPLTFVRDVVALDAEGRRALLGPYADPLAFVIQRPWIPGAVQVLLDDPADPTPYWLVSTRDPEGLAEALLTGAGRHAPADPPRGSPAG